MKLLVFAHRPPPHHGQSAMVATLLDGLAADPEIELLHVDARLSRDSADIGRWRPGKLFALLAAVARAWRLRLRHGDAAFYYIPAPAKRSALYRDFLVLLLCRPLFSRLVLHWHAVGVGAWLDTSGNVVERFLARRLLGRADLAVILSPELADDARAFAPRKLAVVPNCVPDPGPTAPRPTHPSAPCEVLYLALCTRAKGLFDTLDAIALAHARAPGTLRLTVAGTFPDPNEAAQFHARAATLGPAVVRHLGFLEGPAKHAAFAAADVFCFPSIYPHEGQPLVVAEALAHDLPIVTTCWRAIPGMLPVSDHIRFVPAHTPTALADALVSAAAAPRPAGALRRHYLEHYTPAAHLVTLRAALLSTGSDRPQSRP